MSNRGTRQPISRRVVVMTSLALGLAAIVLHAQDGAVFRDPSAQSLFRAARVAVGHGEGSVLALRSLLVKGRSRVVIGKAPAVDTSVEIRVLLPDNYLRIDDADGSRMLTGFSGSSLLTAIEQPGGQRSAPPPAMRGGLLTLEQARLARLMLGMATYVSPYYFVTFRSIGATEQMERPGGAAANVVTATGPAEPNVVEGSGRDGFFVRMFVAPRSYPVMMEYRSSGGQMNTMEFSDRRRVDGLELPFRIVTSDGKRTIDDLIVTDILVNPPLTRADFGPR